MIPVRIAGAGKKTKGLPAEKSPSGLPIVPSWTIEGRTSTGLRVTTHRLEFTPEEIALVVAGGTLQISFIDDGIGTFAVKVAERDTTEDESPYPLDDSMPPDESEVES